MSSSSSEERGVAGSDERRKEGFIALRLITLKQSQAKFCKLKENSMLKTFFGSLDLSFLSGFSCFCASLFLLNCLGFCDVYSILA